jgi:hypothetical protein
MTKILERKVSGAECVTKPSSNEDFNIPATVSFEN